MSYNKLIACFVFLSKTSVIYLKHTISCIMQMQDMISNERALHPNTKTKGHPSSIVHKKWDEMGTWQTFKIDADMTQMHYPSSVI